VSRVRDVVAAVVDPELPALTIADLGVLREVTVDPRGRVEVSITPTYSGCPAMETITADVLAALARAGYPDARVRTVRSPAWTSDWISAEGRRKLAEHGIAPPGPAAGRGSEPVFVELAGSYPGAAGTPATAGPHCPRCGSPRSRLVSPFSATACTALYTCAQCLEPFDQFKAH
jgi:ring-1,2-phenylacetyl-CoA epoxidase subunit PaaD